MTKLTSFLANLAERSISTFVEVFAGCLIAVSQTRPTATLGDPHVLVLAAVGAVAAVLSLLKTSLTQFLQVWAPANNPTFDLTVRVVLTYLESVAALMLVSAQSGQLNVTIAKAALYSSVPAALAVLKGGVASLTGVTPAPTLLTPPHEPAAGRGLPLAA